MICGSLLKMLFVTRAKSRSSFDVAVTKRQNPPFFMRYRRTVVCQLMKEFLHERASFDGVWLVMVMVSIIKRNCRLFRALPSSWNCLPTQNQRCPRAKQRTERMARTIRTKMKPPRNAALPLLRRQPAPPRSPDSSCTLIPYASLWRKTILNWTMLTSSRRRYFSSSRCRLQNAR